MTDRRLIPWAEANMEIGQSPKTGRNHLTQARAGLPTPRPPLPAVKVGGRLFVWSNDLEEYKRDLVGRNGGEPERVGEILPRALNDIASEIERLHPEQAKRLKKLARSCSLKLLDGGQDGDN